MDLNLLVALQPHLLAHDGHEVVFIVQDMVRHHLDVVQHQTLQNRLPDVVGVTLLLVLPVEGAVKERILRIVVVGSAVIHLCATVDTEYQAREHTGSSRASHAVALLVDLLHLFKHIVLNDTLMGVREHGPVFQRILPLLFVPDRIGEGFEVHRAAGVLPAFQNVDCRAVRPFTGIFRQRMGRSTALHAHGEDLLDYLCGLRVDEPVVGIVGGPSHSRKAHWPSE